MLPVLPCSLSLSLSLSSSLHLSRNNGYNKLILAQHLDDLAESFIMSSLHNGQVPTHPLVPYLSAVSDPNHEGKL
jgi:hypothetical protein